jgi:choline-sulfatase
MSGSVQPEVVTIPMKLRPNILIICTDQLSWTALPIYGNRHYHTPNMDRIAQRSAIFSQCYTSTPLCQPARAALWTGHFPHQTGVLSNGRKHPVPPVPAHLPALGELFRAAGYRAAHFGKTHDAGALRGFDVEPVRELPVEGSDAWPVNYDTKQDRYTTTKIVEFLQSEHDRPFLAVADLNNPHNICDWIGRNKGPHEDIPVPVALPPLPPNFRDTDFEQRPLPVQYICCSHNRLSQAAAWNQTNYRHYLAAYGHYLRRVDDEIGLILDALEARGDADNTLIVFLADHGEGLAAHGMVTKQVSFHEEIMRVPFFFAGPGVPGGREVLSEPLVSLLDVLPTLCDYAGVDVPSGLWGRSLAPWMRGERDGSPHPYLAAEWHTEWGYTVEPGRMIRTPRYKYTRYREGDGEELYDLQADPGETRTLIHDPAHTDVLAEHRRLLEAHLEATNDPFFSLQYEVDARWRSHAPGYHNHTGPAAPMVG